MNTSTIVLFALSYFFSASVFAMDIFGAFNLFKNMGSDTTNFAHETRLNYELAKKDLYYILATETCLTEKQVNEFAPEDALQTIKNTQNYFSPNLSYLLPQNYVLNMSDYKQALGKGIANNIFFAPYGRSDKHVSFPRSCKKEYQLENQASFTFDMCAELAYRLAGSSQSNTELLISINNTNLSKNYPAANSAAILFPINKSLQLREYLGR